MTCMVSLSIYFFSSFMFLIHFFSQGQGIILSNDKKHIKEHLSGKVKFVVQKYIERPLLGKNSL